MQDYSDALYLLGEATLKLKQTEKEVEIQKAQLDEALRQNALLEATIEELRQEGGEIGERTGDEAAADSQEPPVNAG